MVLAVLLGEGALRNCRYVVGSTRWPLTAPNVRLQTDGEATFASLKVDVELKHLPKAVRSPWISKETWRLEDWRAALLRAGQESTREVQKARRDFQRALQGDRRQRVQSAGSKIEGLLEAGRVKEAWDHIARWYCHVREKQAHPTRKSLDQE